MVDHAAIPRIRVDKWLWHARVVKTRSLAKTMVQGGHVRINREKIASPSRAVVPGDVLTLSLPTRVRILKVRAPGERRGPAPEAATLYEDLTPPAPPRAERAVDTARREEGAGRPTKRERRAIERLRGRDRTGDG